MQQHFHQQNNPFQHNQMNGQMAAVLFSQAQQQQYHHLLMYGRNGAGEALASTSTITSAAQPGTSTPNFPIYSNQLAVQTTPQIQTQIQHHHFDPTTAPQQQFAPTIAKTMENPLHLLSQPQVYFRPFIFKFVSFFSRVLMQLSTIRMLQRSMKLRTTEKP
jgi:hypothetical protein